MKCPWKLVRCILAWCMLTVCVLVALPGVSYLQTPPPGGSTQSPKHPKLHFRLVELLNKATLEPQKEGLVRIDELLRVQVYIRAEPITQRLVDLIQSFGGKIDRQDTGIIQAWIPVGTLESLAVLPEVQYIQPPDYGHPNVGSVTTEGDTTLSIAAVRSQYGLTGQGVRVGVISTGIKGLATSIVSGDLPPTTFHCQSVSLTIILTSNACLVGEKLIETSGGVTAKSFRTDSDLASDAEGTAMLEIVRDLAPGAELWFANGATGLDIQNAFTFLAANVDIVVADLGFLGFFPDGQNTIAKGAAQIVGSSTNRARVYVTSVGNYALGHYSTGYTDSGVGGHFFIPGLGTLTGNLHLFAANSDTTGPATSSTSNRVTVPPLSTVTISLSWNDPAQASTNDYDLFLTDCLGNVLTFSINPQTGFQEPSETVTYTNSFSSSVSVCYQVQNSLNLAVPRTLNVLINNGQNHLFNTQSKSLATPADSVVDLIAVGAVAA